ncbi:hypothetical protein BSQ98_02850 [Serratia liquefaciens]|uniref:restriction endonuclease subunit S n=1 Tax=Serratia liquefaciens TaxID=614 RepID=UPI0010206AF8|nr:restriction endonuclease subunit S [Serratia liquefaciens]RYM66799.1 hypothetical protein BSQ98_02850 [Serratia liquefaciens]
MVPKEWGFKSLDELALVERGKFSVRPRNDPRYFGGMIPFVQTGDISSAGTYLNKYTQTLNAEGVKVSKVFPKETILITIAANIGDTAITNFDVACPDSVVAIQPYKEMADVFWLKSVLETKRDELDSQSTQNAQKNINLQVLKPLLIKTPPLPEQKMIAQILSTWDKAIVTTEQLLANSQQQKKALMQQLITGNRRFPEFKGRWEKRALSEICILGAGQPAPQEEKYFIDGNHDFLRVSDLGSNTCRWAPQSRDKVNQSAIRECKLGVVPARATLFTKSGASLLLNQRAQLRENSFIVSHLGFAKAKDGVSDDFVFYLMCSIDFNRYAAGTSLPALQLSVLKSLKVLVPPYEEQKKIASMFSDADVEISILEKKLFLLKKEKKALMQQLLTGKRRVKVDAA